MNFQIKDDFYLDGKPFKIISGSIHYFRTVKEYWRDRLEKLVNIGCNTVETYIPWNYHEPKKGEFIWDGNHDICQFLDIAGELGLYIILRPSPYICAEWEFGGLPAWLLKDKNMKVRCSYKPYLDAVSDYYDELIPKLVPYQIDKGGRLILIQIENEYGYYGNDTAYMEFLRDKMRSLGITVPFVTSDGPWKEEIFRSGYVEGALQTGNFGSSADWQFDQMKKLMGDNKPLMCMEFWNGWFDNWGEEHHITEPQKAAAELDALLNRGSMNFYMFQGGTNFGFMNGRNTLTSYDYDAPLTEDGQITYKYEELKQVIKKYRDFTEIPLSTKIKRRSYGEIKCTGKTDLFSCLRYNSTPVISPYPLTMEDIDCYYGYCLYRLSLKDYETVKDISIENASDKVYAYRNGKYLFTAFGDTMGNKFLEDGTKKGGVLDLLVENMSRENFGTWLDYQRKGIAGGVRVNDRRYFGYEIYPIPLDEAQLSKIDFTMGYSKGVPAFYEFKFTVDEKCDTFLDFDGFGHGCAFVNGFNIGRFRNTGPQKRLYIPAPLLKEGENTIILFETEGISTDRITLSGTPLLG